jgi:hypothetical protein
MADSDRVVVWRLLDKADLQQCRLSRIDTGWRLAGTVVTVADDEPAVVHYQVDTDLAWATRRVLVNAAIGLQAPVQIGLMVDAAGQWHAVRQPEPATPWVDLSTLTGLIDVDLAFTPATNTLPVRRLQPAVGETIAVTAAWLRFPELIVEPLPQTYRRDELNLYYYESNGGAFTAEITFDDVGLVFDYQGLWERVASIR